MFCGASNAPDGVFCSECGKRLHSEILAESKAQATGADYARIGIAVTALVIDGATQALHGAVHDGVFGVRVPESITFDFVLSMLVQIFIRVIFLIGLSAPFYSVRGIPRWTGYSYWIIAITVFLVAITKLV
jgi:hypothetical protein